MLRLRHVAGAALSLLILSGSVASVGAAPAPEDSPGPASPLPASLLPESLLPPSLLEASQREARVATAALRHDVERQLRWARERQAVDPRGVRDDLKSLLDAIRRAPELDAATRALLLGKLEAAVREAERMEVDVSARTAEREEAAAAARDRQRVLQDLQSRQERIKQLIERFDGLLSEGRQRVAEEIVAAEILEEAPHEPVAVSVGRQAALARALKESLAARGARHRGMVEALASVELTKIAMPQDEPIVYSAAEVWQDLTRRRSASASVDLRKPTPSEQRIEKALDQTTALDFTETPLRDVVDYLKDLHGIEIQFDDPALAEAGIDVDVPVSRHLDGITLRSALRLLLGSIDLTYILDKEVLLITTPERAREHVVIKVYPVGELVLPVQTPTFSGGLGSPFGNSPQQGQQGGGRPGGMPFGNQNPFGGANGNPGGPF